MDLLFSTRLAAFAKTSTTPSLESRLFHSLLLPSSLQGAPSWTYILLRATTTNNLRSRVACPSWWKREGRSCEDASMFIQVTGKRRNGRWPDKQFLPWTSIHDGTVPRRQARLNPGASTALIDSHSFQLLYLVAAATYIRSIFIHYSTKS